MSTYSGRLVSARLFWVALELSKATQLCVFILGMGYLSLGVFMRVFRVRYGYAYSLLKWFGFVASTQFWSWVQKRLLGPKRTGLSWHFFGGSKQSPPNVNKDTSWETLFVVFCHSFVWNLFVFRSIVTFAHKAQCGVSMPFPSQWDPWSIPLFLNRYPGSVSVFKAWPHQVRFADRGTAFCKRAAALWCWCCSPNLVWSQH